MSDHMTLCCWAPHSVANIEKRPWRQARPSPLLSAQLEMTRALTELGSHGDLCWAVSALSSCSLFFLLDFTMWKEEWTALRSWDGAEQQKLIPFLISFRALKECQGKQVWSKIKKLKTRKWIKYLSNKITAPLQWLNVKYILCCEEKMLNLFWFKT